MPFCIGPILITSCLRTKDTRLSLQCIFTFRESLGTRLPIWYVFAFSTSWFHSALLVQQTFCCKIKTVLSSCSIHVPYPYPHRARQHMDLRFFHRLPSVTMHRDAHTLCVVLHTDTCHSDCCPLSNQTAILTSIDPREHRSSSAQPLLLSRGENRSLGDSHTCLLALSASLQTSRSFTVQVYSAIH